VLFRSVETGFDLKLGKEGVNLPVTTSAVGHVFWEEVGGSWSGKEKATVSSSSNWHLTGPEKGLAFGVS